MGWWSATILGGDTPYDIRSRLIHTTMRLAHEDHFWLERHPIEWYRDRVNKHMDSLVRVAKSMGKEWGDEDIAGQVLGALILETGAQMSDDTRKYVLECAEKDHWANRTFTPDPKMPERYNERDKQDLEERKGYINDFIERIKAYPTEGGVVVKLAQEGLFEKIANGLSK